MNLNGAQDVGLGQREPVASPTSPTRFLKNFFWGFETVCVVLSSLVPLSNRLRVLDFLKRNVVETGVY